MSHASSFLAGLAALCETIDTDRVEMIRDHLRDLKQRRGRVFFLGVGGSAANASHAVNDFRKLCGIECYAPTDNVAELTARTNDDGWQFTFSEWLRGSHCSAADAVFILSVGGGSHHTSPNLLEAITYALSQGTIILGIIGRDGGATKRHADACILVPTIDEARITPYVESAQSLLLHLLATDPALRV
jgi:D-sedoheptulose 7-phosphate isomerase